MTADEIRASIQALKKEIRDCCVGPDCPNCDNAQIMIEIQQRRTLDALLRAIDRGSWAEVLEARKAFE